MTAGWIQTVSVGLFMAWASPGFDCVVITYSAGSVIKVLMTNYITSSNEGCIIPAIKFRELHD